MDYTSLIAPKGTPGSIANWINFSDTLLPLSDVLHEAQALIYDTLRVRYMRSIVDVAIASGDAEADLPTGTLEVLALWDDVNEKLEARDPAGLQSLRAIDTGTNDYSQSRPGYFSVYDEKLQFDVAADQAYTFRAMVYALPPFLGETNLTNFLTTRWPTLLRTACLAIAADWTNDDARYQRFVSRLQPLIEQASVSDDMLLHGMIVAPDYHRSKA